MFEFKPYCRDYHINYKIRLASEWGKDDAEWGCTRCGKKWYRCPVETYDAVIKMDIVRRGTSEDFHVYLEVCVICGPRNDKERDHVRVVDYPGLSEKLEEFLTDKEAEKMEDVRVIVQFFKDEVETIIRGQHYPMLGQKTERWARP